MSEHTYVDPVTPRQRKLKTPQIEAMFRAFHAVEPEPKGELNYVNVYTLLVAVALSAQATDVSVNKATEPLFKSVTTPQQMLDLGEERLKDFIKTIGLYNSKAKNVIAAAQILVERYDGNVPVNVKRLRRFQGLGAKPPTWCCRCIGGSPGSPSTRMFFG